MYFYIYIIRITRYVARIFHYLIITRRVFFISSHSMSINITLKYAFSLKNIVLNYLTHITEFIYPLLEKKNYTNAIARDTKVRIRELELQYKYVDALLIQTKAAYVALVLVRSNDEFCAFKYKNNA